MDGNPGDLGELVDIPLGTIQCIAKAALALEQCVRQGGNLQECYEVFRMSIAKCPPHRGAGEREGGGTSGGGLVGGEEGWVHPGVGMGGAPSSGRGGGGSVI